MRTFGTFNCLAILAALSGVDGAEEYRPKNVLLFLIDGLRWDYIDETRHHGFWTTGLSGVRADHLTPVTPAISYPNWYSLVTGFYTENHGIVGNFMYNQELNVYFKMAASESMEPHWWNQAEPIWVSAVRRNLIVDMHWWDGCQVDFNGTKPNFCTEYKGTWSTVNTETKYLVEKSLKAMKKGSLDMAMFYYEGPDSAGHGYGPDSKETHQTVDDFDGILKSVHAQVKTLGMEEEVNIVIVSDHGMTNTNKEAIKTIDIDLLVDPDDIHIMLDIGPFSMVYPKPDKVMKVYESIKRKQVKGLRAYLKEDVPGELHLKRNRNVGPIVLMADVGYYILPFSTPEKSTPEYRAVPAGSHGYDANFTDMWGIFYASGPAILHESKEVPALVIVDVYNVLCYMLGVVPLRNNGSWARVEGFINPAYDHALYQTIRKR